MDTASRCHDAGSGGRELGRGGVGAAIRTVDGNIYTGVCIDLSSGLGFCAEMSAIAQMVTKRETQIDTVVAVTADRILPPCGRCRGKNGVRPSFLG